MRVVPVLPVEAVPLEELELLVEAVEPEPELELEPVEPLELELEPEPVLELALLELELLVEELAVEPELVELEEPVGAEAPLPEVVEPAGGFTLAGAHAAAEIRAQMKLYRLMRFMPRAFAKIVPSSRAREPAVLARIPSRAGHEL